MPRNPFTDVWAFLTAATGPYLDLGGWRFLVLAVFWLLLIASIAIAWQNWRDDPSQRSSHHVSIAVVRVLIGCMWFEAMLWKLPLPVSGGVKFWTEQEAIRAAFEFHRNFVSNVLLPNLSLFGPVVFLAELTFAVTMIIGLAVRAISAIAFMFVLQLYLGIYLPGDPPEWSWTYIFLLMLLFLFVIEGAGRSLGLDAWLRRKVAAVREGRGLLGTALRLAG
jgi:uncharacterized membrane protein YphA (DoxX/SURF4 family)